MARETFPAYLPELFRHEGGYVDHPRDPGGATNLGITFATLRNWRGKTITKADVKALTKDEAALIYRARYWNLIGADLIPAGPDAALFDVAVNSGVGRARQWRPLIEGKSPANAVRTVCAMRRAFFQSLRTFDVFGKGWMRRVNEVEAWCLKWAVKTQGMDASAVLRDEAKTSKTKSQQSTGAAIGTTGAGGGVATQADYTGLLIVGAVVAVAIGVLAYRAWAESSRAKAMEEAAND